MQAIDLSKINAVEELERLGWEFEPTGSDEIKCRCPNPTHKDSNPSVSLNLETNSWICFGCEAKGDFVTFLSYALSSPRAVVLEDLRIRIPSLFEGKEIPADAIEKHHLQLAEEPQLLSQLYARGVTDEMIRKHRLGAYRHRIIIPYLSATGRYVSMRMYLPGASEKKFITAKGYADPKLFLESQIDKYKTLWMIGGEIKAIVGAELLNQVNVGAFWILAGEGKGFQREWLPRFKGKKIYICMDIDNAGKAATQIYAETLAQVAEVHLIKLPLDDKKYPKGDLNDYVGKEKAGVAELVECMRVAQPFERQLSSLSLPDEILELELLDVFKPAYIDRRVAVEAIIQAKSQEVYHGPKNVKVKCARDQGDICASCPVFSLDIDETGASEVPFESCNPGYLEFPKLKDKDKLLATRKLIGISYCKKNSIETLGKVNISEVRLLPKLKVMDEMRSAGSVKAFLIGATIPELGQTYRLSGGLFSNPQDQSFAFVVTELEEADDTLSSYDPSEDDISALKIFRPDSWTDEDLAKKLDLIYSDIENNVTKIYRRRHLHIVYDLAYHCALMFSMAGKKAVNGWVNAIIVGDSSQGKSETLIRLMKHYGMGEKIDCKNASIAGLIGGLQQLDKSWFITWGVIPGNDRGLVALEEFKGLHTEAISKMTDMRSSGIAELPKIEHEKTFARTRLIAVSNSRFDLTMAEYNFGFKAIQELVGNPEDVRRFDIACIVAKDDIPEDFLHEVFNQKSETPHFITEELSRNLILFAWTRKVSQIRIRDDALKVLNDEAQVLNKKYVQSFPILDSGTTREKIARLAVALAIRTFSTEDNCKVVLVRSCHIRFVTKLLDELYSHPSFGFDKFSAMEKAGDSLCHIDAVKTIFISCSYPEMARVNLLSLSEIMHQDIMDSFCVSREMAYTHLAQLVSSRCLVRTGRGYKKTKAFIRLMSDQNFLKGVGNGPGKDDDYCPF